MEKYKPNYLGKVIPADNPSKMTGFLTHQYDAFSKIYDTCKEQSKDINDIKVVENNSSPADSLTVKISAGAEAVAEIVKKAAGDCSVTVKGDVITANGNKK